jgi:hypothetical protein
MQNRSWVTAAAVTMLALAGTLSGCGASASGGSAANGKLAGNGASSPASSPSSRRSAPVVSPPRVGGAPDIHAINLSTGFSPSTLQIGVGQQFVVIISKDVDVSGLSRPGCTPDTTAQVPGGLLTVRCTTSTDYMYTAEHAGSATLSATVRPHCTQGAVCPQWIAEAHLHITISS